MLLTIKYFGALADITHKKEEQLRFETPDHSLQGIKQELEKKYPAIKTTHYTMALNKSIALPDAKINEHDELALLPPFAGG